MATNRSETAPQDKTSRRGFLNKLWLLLGGAVLLETGWVVADLFGSRRSSVAGEAEDTMLEAGPVDRFEPGSVTAFPKGKFYLVRLDDGGFLALSRSCTHLGCTVPWDAEKRRFVCPCHASSFDIRGAVESPPAPRPLDTFAVRIENNIVKVEHSTPMKRSEVSDDQAVRP